MPALTLSRKDLASVTADVVVVGVVPGHSGGAPHLLGEDALPASLARSLAGSLTALGADGSAGQVVRLPAGDALKAPVVALVGLGPVPGAAPPPVRRSTRGRAAATEAAPAVPGPGPEQLRRAAGAATRALAGTGTVAFALPTPDLAALAAVAEGALFGAYAFRRYRSEASAAGAKLPVREIVLVSELARSAAARAAAKRAEVLADAVHGTRDLVNTPPADLFPGAFADEATALLTDLPVEVTVLDEKKLARAGYGGLVAVGKGSTRPPRLVRLEYAPAGATAHLAFVGKGITFDSGGLSIKPAGSMETMKSDMAGAAAVLHVLAAAARLELPVRITGWLALAENMPSGTAQRPSDVLTTRNGRTVEVLNTDAEGRLVLADALAVASEANPDLIVDVATLTGAQAMALGNRVSAIMANDDDLRSRVHRLADASGEQFWPMPLPPELRSSLDSPVADLANMGERWGGMLVAGLFLKEFVGIRGAGGGTSPARPLPARTAEEARNGKGDQIPWAHLDIAGPSFNTGSAYGYTPVGGTGVAVRTLLALAEDVIANGL